LIEAPHELNKDSDLFLFENLVVSCVCQRLDEIS
jgi:hypothetical protein